MELVDGAPESTSEPEPFLHLRRLHVVNHYTDGSTSRQYAYDCVTREALDAVVLVLTTLKDDQTMVCLRSSIRPPLLLRGALTLPVPDDRPFHTIWELPAGLIEPGDKGDSGIAERASREALEETGYEIPRARFSPLGPAPFLSPGVLPERIHFLTASVSRPDDRTAPLGDGTPSEEGSAIWWVALKEAIALCVEGKIVDTKTELGLRRLEAAIARSERTR